MKTIHKYPLNLESKSQVLFSAHGDARPLAVQTLIGIPCLWMQVDTDEPMQEYVAHIFGTGHQIPVRVLLTCRYVGTYQLYNGHLVFHVYVGYAGNLPSVTSPASSA